VSDIRIEAVAKRFGSVSAVDQVSFTAEAGSFVVLLGPSGCGKSTLLRLVAGLEEVSEGRVHIGGRDVTEAAPSQRGVSMVFQSYALFPHLSVAENIQFGLKVRKVARAERAASLERVTEAELVCRGHSPLRRGFGQAIGAADRIVNCYGDDIMLMAFKKTAGALALAGLAAAGMTGAASATELTMYYPVSVGGPLTKVIDGMVEGFQKDNPDIKINAIYAGNYDDTRVKALTALKSGQPAQLSVLFSIDAPD